MTCQCNDTWTCPPCARAIDEAESHREHGDPHDWETGQDIHDGHVLGGAA